MIDSPSEAPVKPKVLTTGIVLDGDVVRVSMHEANWGCGLFLLLLLATWTIAGVVLLKMVIAKQESSKFFVGILFWTSWIFLAGIILNGVFGRRHLSLDPSGLVHEYRIFFAISRRELPLSEIIRFEVQQWAAVSEEEKRAVIEVLNLGHYITFASEVPDLERHWLCWFLEMHLRQLRKCAGLSTTPSGDLEDCRRCEKPTDCVWDVNESNGSVTFCQRGHVNFEVILGLIFISGLWNTAVGVFFAVLIADQKAALNGDGWLSIFLSLIGFAFIGLVLFCLLLVQLSELVRVTRWVFGRDQIARSTTRMGLPLGLKAAYLHTGIAHIDVRKDLGTSWGKWSATQKDQNSPGDQFGLLISDSSNDEICSILELTLGEARWIKGRLQSDPRFNLLRKL